MIETEKELGAGLMARIGEIATDMAFDGGCEIDEIDAAELRSKAHEQITAHVEEAFGGESKIYKFVEWFVETEVDNYEADILETTGSVHGNSSNSEAEYSRGDDRYDDERESM